jgi:hypothetical protein
MEEVTVMSEDKKLSYEEIKELKPKRLGSSVSMDGDNFVVAIDEQKAYSLTPGAYYVWVKCDGEKTVEELINNISKELSENPETAMTPDELKEPVTEILHQLADAGLINL